MIVRRIYGQWYVMTWNGQRWIAVFGVDDEEAGREIISRIEDSTWVSKL